MTTTIPRRKWLSISERNKHALDIIENTQEENGMTFSQAIFHHVRAVSYTHLTLPTILRV